MFFFDFLTVWGVTHTRPRPSGLFPEGWMIYAITIAYAALGFGLFVVIGKVPRAEAAA
jgi:hypothetical protein